MEFPILPRFLASSVQRYGIQVVVYSEIYNESSDGVKLGAHMKNLESFNNAFPITGTVTHTIDDTVKLTENSDILLLLLKYSHYDDHPDIADLGIDTAIALMNAADKYGNHSAMSACRTAMSYLARRSPTNAIRILPYKIAHGDFNEIDDLVRSTMDLPTQTVLDATKHDPQIYFTYTLYKEKYKVALKKFRDAVVGYHFLTEEYARSCPSYARAAEIFSAQLRYIPSPTEESIEEARNVAQRETNNILTSKKWKSWIYSLKKEISIIVTFG
uniref:Uncharacterized protein n=1 Tax=Moniliophthora roreri TaxID=221103 RepID=A0A0W0EXD6_MONRR